VTWLVCIVYTGSISSDVLRGAAGGIGIYNMFWVEGGILFLTVVVYYSRPSVSIRIVVLSALLSRRCWCGIGQGICVFSFSSNVHIDVDSCLCSLTERNNIFKVNSTGRVSLNKPYIHCSRSLGSTLTNCAGPPGI